MDSTVEKHIQTLQDHGDDDWKHGGVKTIERDARKE